MGEEKQNSGKSQPWQYGVYADISYAADFAGGGSHPWRGKASSNRLNEFSPNMGMFYLRREVSTDSPWGIEIGGQAGYDTDGQLPGKSRLAGYDVLRYLSRANASYRLPVGQGLTLTAGLFNSFIGYESFYAKDNPNYTRSWIADYSPYFLIGAGAQYPVNDRLSVGFYFLSDYDYLAHRNDQPKYGGQAAWRFAPSWKLTQNVFLGPEQKQTDPGYWRYFSDTILQWSANDLTVALAYDAGTEQLAEDAGHKQVLWMGTALFTRWHIQGPWSVALRPELYWDPDGRLTGSRQFIKAVTATLEYKMSLGHSSLALRTEYRYDNSTGKDGGFSVRDDGIRSFVAGQQTLVFSGLLAYDLP